MLILERLAYWTAGLAVLVGASIFVCQYIVWLAHGAWNDLSLIALSYEPPFTGYRWINQTLLRIYTLQLSALLVSGGVILISLTLAATDLVKNGEQG